MNLKCLFGFHKWKTIEEYYYSGNLEVSIGLLDPRRREIRWEAICYIKECEDCGKEKIEVKTSNPNHKINEYIKKSVKIRAEIERGCNVK